MKKVSTCFVLLVIPKIVYVGNYMVMRLPMHRVQHQVNSVERMETSFRLNIFVTIPIIYISWQQYVLNAYLHVQILAMKSDVVISCDSLTCT